MFEVREVGVRDVLRARDKRVERQQLLMKKHGLPLVSFTMNIAGPVKTDGLIRRAFYEGCTRIEAALTAHRAAVCERIQILEFTGNEAVWAVRADASALKAWMCEIEERHPLGRLFDIDVLDAAGTKLARAEHRKCLICGGDVHACARSRAHTAEELFKHTRELIRSFYDEKYVCFIAECAQRALLYEAVTTPKPGLVDAQNNGSHKDMNLFSFMSSAAALGGWFEESARIGLHMRGGQPREIFARLRAEGCCAEAKMMESTGGINTHKGALFSLGILCCAAGRLGEGASSSEILDFAASLAQPSLKDLDVLTSESARTGGERQFLEKGLTGIRGEAASGFPSVQRYGLTALHAALEKGADMNRAGLNALLAMMTVLDDSNILRRCGEAVLREVQQRAKECIERGWSMDDLQNLNDDFVRKNISPGGSADLLAVTYFIYFISQNNGGNCHECKL